MTEIELLPRLYDFIVWYVPKISEYPKKYKYSLGDRMITTLLNLLEQLIEAKYGSRKKAHFLRRANLELEKLRFMLRLSKDMHCISIKTFEYAAKQIQEIGRMIGGWEKHTKGKNNG